MKLKCVFSVEAAYVMAMVIFAVATIIGVAFKLRDNCVTGFVSHEAVMDAGYIEETWDRNSNTESVEDKANRQLHNIRKLSGASSKVSRYEIIGKATVELSGSKSEKEITSFVSNIEDFMRMNAVIEDWRKADNKETRDRYDSKRNRN